MESGTLSVLTTGVRVELRPKWSVHNWDIHQRSQVSKVIRVNERCCSILSLQSELALEEMKQRFLHITLMVVKVNLHRICAMILIAVAFPDVKKLLVLYVKVCTIAYYDPF